MELIKQMNKRLIFKIENRENIKELNKELNDYKALKLKFAQRSYQYNELQRKNFWENYYNAKLNTMFSIIDYHIKKGTLEDKTNPFCFLDNKEEVNKYSAKICKVLSNLNIDIISETEEMTNMYEELENIVEKSKKTKRSFLLNNDFWTKFMKLNYTYNEKFEK